jgi:hypothetical protein
MTEAHEAGFEVEVDEEPPAAGSESNHTVTDRRGTYDRSGGKGIRLPWKTHVQQHVEPIITGNLSVLVDKATCTSNCPTSGKCMEAIGTIQKLKVCAAESFGEAALAKQWENITSNHTAVVSWFQLALAGRIVDGAGTVTEVSDAPAPLAIAARPFRCYRPPPHLLSTSQRRGAGRSYTRWVTSGSA